MVVNFNNEANKENDLKELMKKNLELTEEIHQMTKSIKSFIGFQKFMSFVYFLIIVVPIVLSIIYLPPLINQLLGQYQAVLGNSSGAGLTDILKSGGLDLNKLNLKGVDLKNFNPNNLPVKK